MVDEAHEVQTYTYAHLDVVDVGSVADLGLVHDIAAAGAKLQLIAVLDGDGGTLLLSNSMSLL